MTLPKGQGTVTVARGLLMPGTSSFLQCFVNPDAFKSDLPIGCYNCPNMPTLITACKILNDSPKILYYGIFCTPNDSGRHDPVWDH